MRKLPGKDRGMRELLRELNQLGLEVTTTKGNHLRVQTPDGVVFMPHTPSDHRSVLNARAKLRRAGVPLR